jgi:rod shape-determining protein MreD
MINMYVRSSLIDKISLTIPMVSLVTVCLVQWLFIPNTGFYLVFDKLILFYWLVYRPDRISILWVCILYLVPDIKEGWAMGFSSLTTLLFIWTILLQRHVLLRQAFIFQWFALGILIAIYFVLLFVTYSFMASHTLEILPLFVSGFLAILAYPLIVKLLAKLQRIVPMHFELEG